MKKIIVVNSPKSWKLNIPNVEVVSAKSYLTGQEFAKQKNARVFNLCRDFKYQSKGYYVSLLAEARGHKVIPNVKTVQDLKAPAIARIVSDELHVMIQKSLRKIKSKEFTLSIYFGKNLALQYEKLSYEIYKLFQAPLLRVKFVHNKSWELKSIKSISFNEIPETHMPYVYEFAQTYFNKKRYDRAKTGIYQYDLAIMVNPEETSPPSNKKAISRFMEVAEKQGFSVELVTKDDYNRIGEFDALFIRETTSVNHHTYRMARRAQSEGLAVIDDPDSILRCTNKVYLAELLQGAKVMMPETVIVHSENKDQVEKQLGLPCVLKLPDSSFSQGVMKAKTPEDLEEKLNEMLQVSELVIAQKYMPTDFDWRIGVIDNQVIYACKYYMAKGHWQIYNWSSKTKKEVEGHFDNVPIEAVPEAVINTALKATSLIGNGLYGVDIKEIDNKAYIIEVNDNPNIDYGVEDTLLKDELYIKVIQALKNRIELKAIAKSGIKQTL
jgi:glutathione synthase/RimK-type ligase-like ATP-grasp enzyme